MRSTELVLLLLLLLGVVASLRGLTRSADAGEDDEPSCPGSSSAEEAMRSTETLRISRTPGIGLTFLSTNNSASPLVGGPNVTRGIVILPETGVAPEAYAPYARGNATFSISEVQLGLWREILALQFDGGSFDEFMNYKRCLMVD
jgi:hypothetical protein